MSGRLKELTAAILCGGRSRRMGFDKALGLRSRDGRPLLAVLAGELAGRFGEVLLVAEAAAKLTALEDLKEFRILEDLHPGTGPAGAVHTALAACPGRTLFVLACDSPVIDWGVVESLESLLTEAAAEAAVPRHGRRLEPLYAFYGPGAEPVFRRGLAEGRRKILDFYPGLRVAYLDLDEEAAAFAVNLNTPADLERAGLPRPDSNLS